MGHRDLRLPWDTIEIIEDALQIKVDSIERVDRKAIFTNETRKVILKERKKVADVLYKLKNTEYDI